MKKILAAAVITLLAWSARTACADWAITTADFKEVKRATINEWTAAEGLSFTPDNGELVKVKSRELVSLVSDRRAAPKTGRWQLSLRNGDSLLGEPTGISGQTLNFKVAELGTIGVPLKNIAAMTSTEAKNLVMAAPSDKDLVRLKNGDAIEGIFVTITGDKLQMQNDAGETAVDLARVERLTLGGAFLPRTVPPLSARITTISGSVLTVPLEGKEGLGWRIAEVSFTDPAGQARKTSSDQLLQVEVLGGRVVWLTELDPAKDVQSTFMGTKWPTQSNRNVVGGPMRMSKTDYRRGLGVHTRSALTFELDGSFDTLLIRGGMDDSAAPHGQAKLSIVLDGKTLWQSETMKAGEISTELSLPVKNGRTLELKADPADKLDVLGRVNWVNAALIRK